MPEWRDQLYLDVVERLVALYERPFGGKARGRYRVSMKLMRGLFGQRRVWPEQIEAIRRGLYDRGYLLVDMESYCVVVSHQTFASYRRVNDACLVSVLAAADSDELQSDPEDVAGKGIHAKK